MVTDAIGDYLTRIRNALQRGQKEVQIPSSKILLSISEILKKEGFIEEFSEEDKQNNRKVITVKLKYLEGRKGAIRGLERISKPGVRVYIGYRKIPSILGGLGITLLTTPKGVMTGEMARKQRIGGELMCKVW